MHGRLIEQWVSGPHGLQPGLGLPRSSH